MSPPAGVLRSRLLAVFLLVTLRLSRVKCFLRGEKVEKVGRKSRFVRWLLGSLLLVAVACGVVFLLNRSFLTPHAHAQEDKVQTEQTTVSSVTVVNPKQGVLDRTTVQPGSVQAFESVQLYAGVSGYLKTLNVDIGDRMKKGQILAQVDVPELEKQVQRHGAVIEQSRARVAQMKARAVSARAEQEAARSAIPRAEAMLKSKTAELRYRQQQLQRIRDLAASRSIEDKLVDESISHRDAVREGEIAAQEGVVSARASLAAMAAKVLAADADIAEAEAQVKVAQADLEKAQVLIRFSTVVAPFDGVIAQRNFFPGDFVRAANEGGAHIPLLTVQRTNKMRVVVQIPDRDVPYCDPGDAAFVEIDAIPGQKLPATVSRIASSEDQETRLMRVEVDMPNPSGKIVHGMYGKVTIMLQKSDVLLIPPSCLVGKTRAGKGSVFVVRDGRAFLTPVSIGSDNGLELAILSGLTPTSSVIARPSGALVDNTPVTSLTPAAW